MTNRFTLDGANNRAPVWSRDGSHIAFQADRDGMSVILVKAAGGESQEVLYRGDEQDSPTDFAPNNQGLVFTSTRRTGTDVFLLPLAAGFKPSPPVRALAHTRFQEGQGKISIGRRWWWRLRHCWSRQWRE